MDKGKSFAEVLRERLRRDIDAATESSDPSTAGGACDVETPPWIPFADLGVRRFTRPTAASPYAHPLTPPRPRHVQAEAKTRTEVRPPSPPPDDVRLPWTALTTPQKEAAGRMKARGGLELGADGFISRWSVKKGYRALARALHPDLSGPRADALEFHRMRQDYLILMEAFAAKDTAAPRAA